MKAFFESAIRRMRWRPQLGRFIWPAWAAAGVAVALSTCWSVGSMAARIDVASAAVHPSALNDRASSASARARLGPLPAVRAAVRAAQQGAPIPSPLIPPVSDLSSDFYQWRDLRCVALAGQTSSKICPLGDTTAPKTLVVFGDSHADMWLPAILSMAQRDGWKVIPLIKVGCIPRMWRSKGSGECITWYRWAVARVAKLHPEVALIAGSWAGAWAPELAVHPITTLSITLKRSAGGVVVLGDAPTQSRDPTDCLLASGATMATCSTKASESQLRADNRIATNARRDGIGFINTRGWFCAHPSRHSVQYLCPLVINKTITAVDRGHASKTYVLELAKTFRAAFWRAALASLH